MKIYEIDTKALQTKFNEKGSTCIKMVLYEDYKKQLDEYDKLFVLLSEEQQDLVLKYLNRIREM